MKKSIILFFLSFVLTGLHAQVPMSIPNGSFEQWSDHAGYSVTVYSVPIMTVYDTYSTPSTWNYPSYPVSQPVSMMGFNVTINTNIPLIKASQETGVVPDGNKAVRLQTFKLEDIITPTVLSLAGDYFDTSLIQQVIPSILSTGAVDIDAFIPLITSLMSGSGDIFSMLPTLLAVDVNDYITGGLALGDFRPGRLTGSYKYHSAVSGDNGGVLLLGTHYNSTTHQRDIVGGGMNLELVDTTQYAPFEAEYMSLGGVAPDSLIILLLSSAGENRQQGSYLCIDNLMLWPAPDTCADVTGLSAVPNIHEAVLSWNVSDSVDGFEYEYGPVGFAMGTGTTATTTATTLTLSALAASTTYELYVRTLCSDTVYGEWSVAQFTTLDDTCTHVTDITAVPAIHEVTLGWSAYGAADGFELEYGPAGFILGNGATTTATTTTITLSDLEANTTYDVYVRSLCPDDIYGEWCSAQFTTLGAEGIFAAEQQSTIAVAPNPANGQCTVTVAENTPAELKLYTLDGRLVQTVVTDGSPVVLSLPGQGLFLLHVITPAGATTCKIANQ